MLNENIPSGEDVLCTGLGSVADFYPSEGKQRYLSGKSDGVTRIHAVLVSGAPFRPGGEGVRWCRSAGARQGAANPAR
jgi:hypothetical protein